MKQTPTIILLIILTLALSFSTNKRNFIWKTDIGLWLDVKNKTTDSPKVLTSLANAFDNYGYIDEAIKYYNQAIDLDKNYAKAQNNLGVIYFIKRDINLSLSHLNNALEANPKYIEALYNLATIYQSLDKQREAITLYDRLLNISPSHFKALNNIGLSYHEVGDYKMAIKSFQKALNYNNDNIKILINLSSSYIKKGDKAQAEFILQRVMERQPLNKEATMLLNQVTVAPFYYKQDTEILLPQ